MSLIEVSVVSMVDDICPVDLVIEVSMLVLVLMRIVAVEMVVMGRYTIVVLVMGRYTIVVLVMVRLIVPVVVLEAMHVGVVVGRAMVRVRIVCIVCVMEVSVVGWRDMGVVRVRMASVDWDAILHLLSEEDL